jgi:hypothetical protein
MAISGSSCKIPHKSIHG